ncbi:hypothetical protein [Pandoravirus japonicus]|uniref:Uncharacterized protein n=1 Tax=Pandoravirus japonicus TaxID=2823154 RepID=A0A811BMV5_9VIRU|nr:hypothetical protein [Pandoravirus japonicus]
MLGACDCEGYIFKACRAFFILGGACARSQPRRAWLAGHSFFRHLKSTYPIKGAACGLGHGGKKPERPQRTVPAWPGGGTPSGAAT